MLIAYSYPQILTNRGRQSRREERRERPADPVRVSSVAWGLPAGLATLDDRTPRGSGQSF
jgi:hypothetical protein